MAVAPMFFLFFVSSPLKGSCPLFDPEKGRRLCLQLINLKFSFFGSETRFIIKHFPTKN